MRIRRIALSIAIPLAAAILSCNRPPQPSPAATKEISQELFLNIAQQYTQYVQINSTARLAPTLCAPPMPQPDMSRSTDAATHGQKLFFLFARDGAKYLSATTKMTADQIKSRKQFEPANPPPLALAENVQQVLVKESFLPPAGGGARGAAMDLFLMVQYPASTPGTDNGWVYAVVAPDLKTVKASGQIQSCAGCHAAAPYDHLFGLNR